MLNFQCCPISKLILAGTLKQINLVFTNIGLHFIEKFLIQGYSEKSFILAWSHLENKIEYACTDGGAHLPHHARTPPARANHVLPNLRAVSLRFAPGRWLPSYLEVQGRKKKEKEERIMPSLVATMFALARNKFICTWFFLNSFNNRTKIDFRYRWGQTFFDFFWINK